MPRVRVRRFAGNTRRSLSASSAPVGRIRSRTRRSRQNVVHAGRGRRGPNTNVPRPRLRNLVDVSASGRINRRDNRRNLSASPMALPTSRESLHILRSYLSDCERNLNECQQQRGRLAHMVEQLIHTDNQLEPNPTTTLNMTQEEYQFMNPTGENVVETTRELSELITSVRFVAEHRGEDAEHTLNELMRLRSETSPLPFLEMDLGGGDNNPSAPHTDDDLVDYEFNSSSEMNGILTVVFGMEGSEQGGVNGDDGSNQL